MATDPEAIYRERYKNVTDLRQYDKQFKVTNDGTNGDVAVERIWEWCIMGKHGQIYPSGFNGDLSVLVTSNKISVVVAEILKGYRKPGLGNQGIVGETECAMRFPNDPALVTKIATVLRAKRSRKGQAPKHLMDPAFRAKGMAALKAYQEKKKAEKAALAAPIPA
jgi:hypothetical protein